MQLHHTTLDPWDPLSPGIIGWLFLSYDILCLSLHILCHHISYLSTHSTVSNAAAIPNPVISDLFVVPSKSESNYIRPICRIIKIQTQLYPTYLSYNQNQTHHKSKSNYIRPICRAIKSKSNYIWHICRTIKIQTQIPDIFVGTIKIKQIINPNPLISDLLSYNLHHTNHEISIRLLS